jgi:hypothetical protein
MAWARVADAGEAAAEATFDSLAPAEDGRFLIRLSDSLFLAPQSDLE